MLRRAVVLMIACAAGGCAGIFDLEHVNGDDRFGDGGDGGDGGGSGDIVPTQQKVTMRSNTGLTMPVTHSFAVAPTTAGHALVVIAVITTSSYQITRITDDGGNLWARVVVGEDPDPNPPVDCHLEVWVSASTTSAAMVTVELSNDRHLGVSFTEWPVPGQVGPTAMGAFAITATPTTGAVAVGRRSLLLATVAHVGGAPVIDGSGYTPLGLLSASDVSGTSSFRTVDAGTHQATWTVGAAVPSIAALVPLATN